METVARLGPVLFFPPDFIINIEVDLGGTKILT